MTTHVVGAVEIAVNAAADLPHGRLSNHTANVLCEATRQWCDRAARRAMTIEHVAPLARLRRWVWFRLAAAVHVGMTEALGRETFADRYI